MAVLGHVSSPTGIYPYVLRRLDGDALAAKTVEMEPFIRLLYKYGRYTGWFINSGANSLSTIFVFTNPILAVLWIKKKLSQEEWSAIFNNNDDDDGSDQSQQTAKDQESAKENEREAWNNDDQSESSSNGGLRDEDLL